MGERDRVAGERAWFYDVRTPERRMAVHAHDANGVVVLSFWNRDTCTGTFRLPLAESARVITALADGMASGLREPGYAPPTAPPAPKWRAWLQRYTRRASPKAHGHLWVVR